METQAPHGGFAIAAQQHDSEAATGQTTTNRAVTTAVDSRQMLEMSHNQSPDARLTVAKGKCENCQRFGHAAKECRSDPKPERVYRIDGEAVREDRGNQQYDGARFYQRATGEGYDRAQ